MRVRIFPKVIDTRGMLGQSFALDLDETGAATLLDDAVIILSFRPVDTPVLNVPGLQPGARETNIERPHLVRLSPEEAADRTVRRLGPVIRELAQY